MLNTGPFQLKTGEPIDIIAAYHFERGSTNLESVTLGKAMADYLLHNFLVSIKDDERRENLVTEFKLNQNYPNPFNPSTRIQYQISPGTQLTQGAGSNSHVSLKVYDILGNEIATLVNEYKPTGSYEVEFSARGGQESGIRNLASGIYFYQLKAGDYLETKKMLLLR